jgi:hypothetical protein
MRHLFKTHVWVVAVASVQVAAGEPVNPSEWRYFSPILSSQIRRLGQGESNTILAGFCQTPARSVPGVGPTCTMRRLGSGFSDIVDRTFHPKGVIFGHFLGPESDDAAVSGSSAESHPERWGGTLLLSKRGGVWVPVWYRSALIIDSCEKVTLPNRREVLLCEDEDGGMGHALHYLYTVDFDHPADLQRSLLAKADSFKDGCVSQKQVLKSFHWESDRQGFSVEADTTEWQRLSTEPYCANYPKRRPASVRLTFEVTPEGLHKVEAEPAAK